ncbi:C-type lectin-like [Trinorchestia longiramus]|nr:C-type lectin-like [Trinorchestia longiramus]
MKSCLLLCIFITTPLLCLCVTAPLNQAVGPDDVAVYQFQENDRPSDSYITLDRSLGDGFHNLTSLSVCARVRFFSLWEVSRFIQLTNEHTMEHTLQIDVDVRRIRVSLGGVRRYHTLSTSLQALTWHHLCVTYNDELGQTISFLNSIMQDQHHTDVTPSVVGSKIKIGAGDASSNFHGELSQVNIWSRILQDEEIRSLAMCKTNLEGDILSWSNDWISHGKVIASRESSHFFCKTVFDPKLYLFHPMRLYHAFALCEGLGGYLPTPENESSLAAYQKAVLGLSSSGNFGCEGYWIGATDEKNEGYWKRMTDGRVITPHWKPNEPDGGEVQNCAQGTLGEDMALKDIPCDGKQCVLCELPKLPTWSLLGACQIHDRNRLFAPVQKKPGDLIFEGYSFYTIEKQNNTWHWVERHGENENRTIAKLISGSSIKKSWPIGRQSWQFEMSVCEEEPGEVRTLLFSPCKEGHFTCDDATCIPLFQRCDLKPDCRDGSDEKDCRLVQFPPTYRSDIPPAALGSENPLQVALHITIESADINTASMMMHVNFNLTMTWSDQRLEYLNLNEDRTLNR